MSSSRLNAGRIDALAKLGAYCCNTASKLLIDRRDKLVVIEHILGRRRISRAGSR